MNPLLFAATAVLSFLLGTVVATLGAHRVLVLARNVLREAKHVLEQPVDADDVRRVQQLVDRTLVEIDRRVTGERSRSGALPSGDDP